MKKWLIILAVGFTAVSCQWWHETFDDVEECTEWYLDELDKTNNLKDFEGLYNDYTEWRNELGFVDALKARKAANDWREDNEKESEKMNEKIDELYEKYQYDPR